MTTQLVSFILVFCGKDIILALAEDIYDIYYEKIYSSIDFLTKCGIGLYRSYANYKGYRSCVDGTFLKRTDLKTIFHQTGSNGLQPAEPSFETNRYR